MKREYLFLAFSKYSVAESKLGAVFMASAAALEAWKMEAGREGKQRCPPALEH